MTAIIGAVMGMNRDLLRWLERCTMMQRQVSLIEHCVMFRTQVNLHGAYLYLSQGVSDITSLIILDGRQRLLATSGKICEVI